MKTLDKILEGLMRRYKERVPDVNKVTNALLQNSIIQSQEEISNDHIAFRTMGVAQLGIASFEKIFLKYGYRPMDEFFFEGKKLDARWYAPPSDKYPRVFISELRIQDLPSTIQDIITSYTDEVESDPVENIDLNYKRLVNTLLG